VTSVPTPSGGEGDGFASSPLGGAASSSKGTGLAARRNFSTSGKKQLRVTTHPATSPRPQKKSIRIVNNFTDYYDLGGEVMPSCHRGMQVLHAVRKSNGTEVVVKVRSKAEPAGRKRRKAQWLAGAEFMLNLPPRCNIARIYEVLEDTKAYYVVMEKVAGRDLFESISGKATLPMVEIKEILTQILTALADLHAQGHIHKDLKLENVMLDRTPPTTDTVNRRSWKDSSKSSGTMSPSSPSPLSVKIIDFDTLECYETKTPKQAKDVLGTNQYIAQEAYDGQYSPASDIFAAGVIGYRLLTGKYPFKSDIFDDKPGENWVGSPKMQEIRAKVCGFKIKWNHPAFEEEPASCDLLQRMLGMSARDRPSAQEALEHPWLSARIPYMAAPLQRRERRRSTG